MNFLCTSFGRSVPIFWMVVLCHRIYFNFSFNKYCQKVVWWLPVYTPISISAFWGSQYFLNIWLDDFGQLWNICHYLFSQWLQVPLVCWSFNGPEPRSSESKRETAADIPWFTRKANRALFLGLALLHVGTRRPLEWVKAQCAFSRGA